MFMVNNNLFKGGGFPLFLFLCLLMSLNINAQKLSKYYTSLAQEDGTLYFIHPPQKFGSKHNTLSYDLTYKTNSDTITFNFTFIDDKLNKLDSLILCENNIKYSSCLTKIFVQYKKTTKCLHRYSAKFTFSDLQKIYNSSLPPLVNVVFGNESVQLSMKSKKWYKDADVVSKIFKMIEVNKE